uniref:Ig-like domain-containing protein n=1 Tax=Labrus bergylta TaxID=56723 RepID=A0A3Q3F4C8_9LABR
MSNIKLLGNNFQMITTELKQNLSTKIKMNIPSAEIVENSTVTLTCSSDANPAANYTWYKKNGNPRLSTSHKGPELVFSSVQSSDSGESTAGLQLHSTLGLWRVLLWI